MDAADSLVQRKPEEGPDASVDAPRGVMHMRAVHTGSNLMVTCRDHSSTLHCGRNRSRCARGRWQLGRRRPWIGKTRWFTARKGARCGRPHPHSSGRWAEADVLSSAAVTRPCQRCGGVADVLVWCCAVHISPSYRVKLTSISTIPWYKRDQRKWPADSLEGLKARKLTAPRRWDSLTILAPKLFPYNKTIHHIKDVTNFFST
jgi:hypothetical protein